MADTLKPKMLSSQRVDTMRQKCLDLLGTMGGAVRLVRDLL